MRKFSKLSSVRFLLLLLSLALLGNQQAFSQEVKVITGKVTDAQDQSPISGATVTLKNASKGTVTDASGNFKISVPSNSTLYISCFVRYLFSIR